MDHLLFDIVNLFGSVGETRLSVSTNLRLSNGAKYQPQTKEVFMAYPIWEGDLDFFMNQELNERISEALANNSDPQTSQRNLG